MKKPGSILVITLLLSAFITPPKDEDTFRRLYALEGTWMMQTSKGSVGEEWIKINNAHLQNRGFMVKGTDTIVTETVALTKNTKGIFYTSTVSSQNEQQPVAFRLTSSLNNTFFFENPAHDFPKRITYHFVNKDSLQAWIDGGSTGVGKKISFYYSRVK